MSGDPVLSEAPVLTVVAVDGQTVPVASQLLGRFFAEEGFRTDAPTAARNLAMLIADPHHWAALAYANAGQVAGVVTATTMLFVEWGRLGEIGDLYVLPDQRGRGVARALVDAATAWCRAIGCTGVTVTITPEGQAAHGLADFYAKLGFRPTGRTASTLDLRTHAG